MRVLSFAVIYSLFGSIPLNAGVVERDFITPGDGLLTYDDVNHREWLDLPYTYGTDLEKIRSHMKPGRFLNDFSFATQDDVEELNSSAKDGQPNPLGIDELIDHLGFIFRGTGGLLRIAEFTLGQVAVGFDNEEPFFDDKNVVLLNLGGTHLPDNTNRSLLPSGPNGRELIVARPSDFDGMTIGLPNNFFAPQLAAGDIGPFWLYRSAVPEPSSISFLLVGMFVPLVRRRRR